MFPPFHECVRERLEVRGNRLFTKVSAKERVRSWGRGPIP